MPKPRKIPSRTPRPALISNSVEMSPTFSALGSTPVAFEITVLEPTPDLFGDDGAGFSKGRDNELRDLVQDGWQRRTVKANNRKNAAAIGKKRKRHAREARAQNKRLRAAVIKFLDAEEHRDIRKARTVANNPSFFRAHGREFGLWSGLAVDRKTATDTLAQRIRRTCPDIFPKNVPA